MERNRTTYRSMLAALLVVSVAALILANRYVVAKSSLEQAQQTKAQKWEYCHLYSGGSVAEEPRYRAQLVRDSTPEGNRDEIGGKDEVAILNKLGAEGWEVVGMIPATGYPSPEYLLKRPK
jgi:hypothetical protein